MIDAAAAEGRAAEMDRMQGALTKRNQELMRVQRELQQLKEGSLTGAQWKAKAAKTGAEVTRLEMRLRVAMADKPALENTRMELLSIERKLQDSEFEKHRLQSRLDGLQNQQQAAVAAAESRNAQTLEATQRQLQVMHKEVSSQMAQAAQAVAPHAGAWIETRKTQTRWKLCVVAPHAGAWIETAASADVNIGARSHPMRVRGLKLNGVLFAVQ